MLASKITKEVIERIAKQLAKKGSAVSKTAPRVKKAGVKVGTKWKKLASGSLEAAGIKPVGKAGTGQGTMRSQADLHNLRRQGNVKPKPKRDLKGVAIGIGVATAGVGAYAINKARQPKPYETGAITGNVVKPKARGGAGANWDSKPTQSFRLASSYDKATKSVQSSKPASIKATKPAVKKRVKKTTPKLNVGVRSNIALARKPREFAIPLTYNSMMGISDKPRLPLAKVSLPEIKPLGTPPLKKKLAMSIIKGK